MTRARRGSPGLPRPPEGTRRGQAPQRPPRERRAGPAPAASAAHRSRARSAARGRGRRSACAVPTLAWPDWREEPAVRMRKDGRRQPAASCGHGPAPLTATGGRSGWWSRSSEGWARRAADFVPAWKAQPRWFRSLRRFVPLETRPLLRYRPGAKGLRSGDRLLRAWILATQAVRFRKRLKMQCLSRPA